MTTETPELPPLFEAYGTLAQGIPGYSINQLRAYARQAVAEALAGREGAVLGYLYEHKKTGNSHIRTAAERLKLENYIETPLFAHPAAQPAPAEPVAYCERCGEEQKRHGDGWCDNQSFAAHSAPAPAQGERELLRECLERLESDWCMIDQEFGPADGGLDGEIQRGVETLIPRVRAALAAAPKS